MPAIDLVICEIAVFNLMNFDQETSYFAWETRGCILSVESRNFTFLFYPGKIPR